jgi:hypothetical protein
VKQERSKEEYNNIEKNYISNVQMNPIQTIFFDNLKHIFNSYNSFYEKIESEYKFYLAFENSICTDYISEKFFYTLRYNIVPIVFGGANYEEIAPPHSYIDTRNFQSPKELALYILNLNSNDTLYYEYFKWKREFYVDAGIHNMSRQGFCELCSKLNRFDEPEKHYASLANDYSIDSNCIVLNENLI